MMKALWVVAILLMIFLMPVPMFAADTWTGGGGNDDWGTAGNWDVPPVFPTALTFAGTTRLTPNNDQVDVTVNGFTFSDGAGAFVISGNAITLAGNVANNDDSLQTINLAMAMAATRTFSATTGDIALGGVLSGAGGLTKDGSNTLTLSGANTYTGATTVSAGTLEFGAGASMTGAGAIDVSGASGTALDIMDGAVVISTSTAYSYAGNADGSDGTITVDGTDSALTLSGTRLYLGANGTATGKLIIRNGGSVSSNSLYSATGVGSSCEITVDGVGSDGVASTWTSEAGGSFGRLGQTGTAILTISNGGLVTSGASPWQLGTTAAGSGTIDIRDTGSKLTMTAGNIYVGLSGTGVVTVSDGGTVHPAYQLQLGWNAGANGTLNVGKGGAAGTVDAGRVIGNLGTATINFNHSDASYSFSPIIAGPIAVNHIGTGTTTLSAVNTYTGLTTIDAGTLVAGSTSALGTGAVTNNATLDLGTTSLSGIGVYTQSSGSTLNLTANSSSSFGNMASASDAVVDDASTVAVTVGGYIANGATLLIIDGAGGTDVEVPATITSSSSKVSFSGVSSGGDLILTASRAGTGFASVAANSNETNIGSVLDNVTSPTSDMQVVLDTLDGLNTSQTDQALNSLQPNTDGSSLQVTQAALNLLTDAILGHQASIRGSGVSTGGGMLKGLDVWAQAFGSYLHAGPQAIVTRLQRHHMGHSLRLRCHRNGEHKVRDMLRLCSRLCKRQG